MTTITWEIRTINMDGRFEISEYDDYDEAKKCYAVIATGEGAVYANIILQKGVVK